MSTRACTEPDSFRASWQSALAALLLLLATSTSAQSDGAAGHTIDTFRGLRIRLVDADTGGPLGSGFRDAVVLEDAGREVWRSSDTAFVHSMRIGVHGLADIDADGTPELHLVGWSGGAHCCTTHGFLQRDDRWGVYVKATVDQGNGEQSPLLTIEGHKRPVMLVPDNVFAYAFGSVYAGSPMPWVPLSYDGARFSIASDVMKQPELLDCLMSLTNFDSPDYKLLATRWRAACRELARREPDEESDTSERIRSTAASPYAEMLSNNCDLCVIAANVMNPLVYAGEFAKAEAALARVWPAGVPGRQQVTALYWSRLRESIYWIDIQAVHFDAVRRTAQARTPGNAPSDAQPRPTRAQ